jgi:hypothetical protein
MFDLDEEGLAARCPIRKKRKPKGHFTTKGVNWVYYMDGHDKLMGYKNSTFPLAVYGCIDTASRRLLWLRVWVSNSDPNLIGRWYLEYLFECRVMPSILRLDKGTETGVMATMHAFLRQSNGDMDPSDMVIYGPSTSNQVMLITQGGTQIILGWGSCSETPTHLRPKFRFPLPFPYPRLKGNILNPIIDYFKFK